MEEVKRREYPEKIMKLVRVAPRSIRSSGKELTPFFITARAIACDSISKATGIRPAFLIEET